MTETDWLVSCDPLAMLRFYTSDEMSWPAGTDAPEVSPRKLRLFACATARQNWDRLGHDLVRDCVEAAEQYADGDLPLGDMINRHHDAFPLLNRMSGYFRGHADEAIQCCQEDAIHAARYMMRDPVCVPLATQADLLRDVIGNPFQTVKFSRHGVDDVYCPWLTPAVLGLANDVYANRRWDLLPVLADALEDAGAAAPCSLCDSAGQIPSGSEKACARCLGSGFMHPVVSHLRSPGPHARGCWAVDLLLGKE